MKREHEFRVQNNALFATLEGEIQSASDIPILAQIKADLDHISRTRAFELFKSIVGGYFEECADVQGVTVNSENLNEFNRNQGRLEILGFLIGLGDAMPGLINERIGQLDALNKQNEGE